MPVMLSFPILALLLHPAEETRHTFTKPPPVHVRPAALDGATRQLSLCSTGGKIENVCGRPDKLQLLLPATFTRRAVACLDIRPLTQSCSVGQNKRT